MRGFLFSPDSTGHPEQFLGWERYSCFLDRQLALLRSEWGGVNFLFAPLGLWLASASGRFLFFEPRGCRNMGLSRGEYRRLGNKRFVYYIQMCLPLEKPRGGMSTNGLILSLHAYAHPTILERFIFLRVIAFLLDKNSRGDGYTVEGCHEGKDTSRVFPTNNEERYLPAKGSTLSWMRDEILSVEIRGRYSPPWSCRV